RTVHATQSGNESDGTERNPLGCRVRPDHIPVTPEPIQTRTEPARTRYAVAVIIVLLFAFFLALEAYPEDLASPPPSGRFAHLHSRFQAREGTALEGRRETAESKQRTSGVNDASFSQDVRTEGCRDGAYRGSELPARMLRGSPSGARALNSIEPVSSLEPSEDSERRGGVKSPSKPVSEPGGALRVSEERHSNPETQKEMGVSKGSPVVAD